MTLKHRKPTAIQVSGGNTDFGNTNLKFKGRIESYVADATPAGLVLSIGDSSYPATTTVADKKSIAVYTGTTAVSGDSRGMYLKHKLGGVIASTGYGDAIRTWAEVTGTGYSYATGCHSTMSIAVGGTVTGSGSGLRATLGAAAATRTLAGALSTINLDTDIAAGNTMPARSSIIRVTKAGAVDITNFLDIADDQCLKGSAATGAATDALPVIMPDGSTLYISLIAAS